MSVLLILYYLQVDRDNCPWYRDGFSCPKTVVEVKHEMNSIEACKIAGENSQRFLLKPLSYECIEVKKRERSSNQI